LSLTAALVNATGRSRLEELRLSGTAFHGQGLSDVLASPALAGLRRLTLRPADLSDDGLERLARAPVLAGVRRLALAVKHRARDRGLRALFGSPHLEAVTHLSVSGGQVTPEAAAALAGNPACRRLRVLSLGSPTSSAVLAALTGGEPFPDLHTIRLEFWRHALEPEALEAFLDSPKLPRLCAMSLSVVPSDHARRLAKVFQGCPRIAWAGGHKDGVGGRVCVALQPENVYLPNHLDEFGEYQ
jgi:hypothetical protein